MSSDNTGKVQSKDYGILEKLREIVGTNLLILKRRMSETPG